MIDMSINNRFDYRWRKSSDLGWRKKCSYYCNQLWFCHYQEYCKLIINNIDKININVKVLQNGGAGGSLNKADGGCVWVNNGMI